MAADPSDICELFPAVWIPPSFTGRSFESPSAVDGRGPNCGIRSKVSTALGPMIRKLVCTLVVGSTGISVGCSSVGPATSTPSPAGSDAAAPMAIYSSSLGPHERLITTRSPEAQAYYKQGVQLLQAFTPPDAVRSFREAQPPSRAASLTWRGTWKNFECRWCGS